jgi:hypothetical protein
VVALAEQAATEERKALAERQSKGGAKVQDAAAEILTSKILYYWIKICTQ